MTSAEKQSRQAAARKVLSKLPIVAALSGGVDCPSCGVVMLNLDDGNCRCDTYHCEFFKSVFRRPRVNLELVIDARDQR